MTLETSKVVTFQPWAKGLFRPHRYKVLYGGRGSGKSYAVADALLLAGYAKPCRILCAREFQNSLSESVLYLLAERIEFWQGRPSRLHDRLNYRLVDGNWQRERLAP